LFQEVSEKAPVNLAEVLRRTGTQVDFAEDEAAAAETAPPRAPTEPNEQSQPACPPPVPARAAKGEEEESIDDYMSKLLARVRGTGPAESPSPARQDWTAKAKPAPAPAAIPARPAEVEAVKPAVPSMPGRTRREPAEMAPRAVAPEKQLGLSGMRELANLSANSALTQHDRRQLSVTTRTKLLVTLVALAVGGSLLWLWRMPHNEITTFYSAIAAFLVAVLWGTQYLVLATRLIAGRLRQLKTNEAGQLAGQHSPTAKAEDENTAGEIDR
jgi:hypothetical protein